MSRYLSIDDSLKDCKETGVNYELRCFVHKSTMKLLRTRGIKDFDDLYKKCEIRYYWGNLSEEIMEEDRITIEKLLLENRCADGFAYHPIRSKLDTDCYVKYDSDIKSDGNLLITSSKPYIIDKHICIDRLNRTVRIETMDSRYEQRFIERKVSYFVIEDLFEHLFDDSFETLYAFGEFAYTENVCLTRLSGKKDEYGLQVTGSGQQTIERFLESLGLDM